MSVSLKKPSNDTIKVDLTKPSVSGKLPECTPVHLIDEEETIKNLSSRSVTPNNRDIQPQARQCTPIHIEQIRLCHSEEEDREIWDKYFELLHRERVKRIFIVTVVVVLVILVCVAFFFLVLNMPFEPVEMPAEEITSNMTEVEYIFSVVSSVIEWFFGSPLFMTLFSLIAIGLLVRCIRKIMKK